MSKLDGLTWTGIVDAVPVGSIIQYRKKDTGEVVHWHRKQASVQGMSKKNHDGTISKVRWDFIQRVEKGELFITFCP